jgi:hypothetical protein
MTIGEDREKLLARIRKLKALADCETGNVNEVATAAATLTRLLLEHNIQVVEIKDPDDAFEMEEFGRTDKRAPKWKFFLLLGLGESMSCKVYSRSGCPVVVGTAEDIEGLRLVYEFCCREIERHCEKWAQQNPLGTRRGQRVTRGDRLDFRLGAADEINGRVRAQRKMTLDQARIEGYARALVHLANKPGLIDDWVAGQTGTRPRVSASYTREVAQFAYAAGVQAGRSIELPP